MFWFIVGMIVGAIFASNWSKWTEALDREYEHDPNPIETRDAIYMGSLEGFQPHHVHQHHGRNLSFKLGANDPKPFHE